MEASEPSSRSRALSEHGLLDDDRSAFGMNTEDHHSAGVVMARARSPSENSCYSDVEDHGPAKPWHFMNDVLVGDICMVCKRKMSVSSIYFKHPVFRGFICADCKDPYITTVLCIDVFGESAYCLICAGFEGTKLNLLVCEYKHCGRAYCSACLTKFFSWEWEHVTSQTEKWFCFLCQEYSLLTHGLLMPSATWKHDIARFLQPAAAPASLVWLPNTANQKKKSKTVFSVFNGVGTGVYTLAMLGLKMSKVYIYEPNAKALETGITRMPSCIVLPSFRYAVRLMYNISFDLLLIGPGWKSDTQEMSCEEVLLEIAKVLNHLRCYNPTAKWLLFSPYPSVGVETLRNKISAYLQCYPSYWHGKLLDSADVHYLIWGNFPTVYSFPDPGFVRQQLQMVREQFPFNIGNDFAPQISPQKSSSSDYGERYLSWLGFAVDTYLGLDSVAKLDGESNEAQFHRVLQQEVDKREKETGLRTSIVSDYAGQWYRIFTAMQHNDGYFETVRRLNTKMELLRGSFGNINDLEREYGLPLHYTDQANLSPAQRRAILLNTSVPIHLLVLLLAPLVSQSYRQARTKVY